MLKRLGSSVESERRKRRRSDDEGITSIHPRSSITHPAQGAGAFVVYVRAKEGVRPSQVTGRDREAAWSRSHSLIQTVPSWPRAACLWTEARGQALRANFTQEKKDF